MLALTPVPPLLSLGFAPAMENRLTIALLILAAGLILAVVMSALSVRKVARDVPEAWDLVRAEMRRRHQLLDQLVALGRSIGFAESTALDDLDLQLAHAAENSAGYPAVPDAALHTREVTLLETIENVLSNMVSSPLTRSHAQFAKLQDQLASSEDRLSLARRQYNDAVRALHESTEAMPGSLLAAALSVPASAPFELEPRLEHVVPRRDLRSITQPGFDTGRNRPSTITSFNASATDLCPPAGALSKPRESEA